MFGGSGASVFFTKEVYSRRRMAKFGLVTNTMLFYFAVIVCVAAFTIKVVESHSFFSVGCVLLLVMFFRNMGNPIAQETARNWLFLVPENPYKKVWFSVLAGVYGTAVDLIPGMIKAIIKKIEIIIDTNIVGIILIVNSNPIAIAVIKNKTF